MSSDNGHFKLNELNITVFGGRLQWSKNATSHAQMNFRISFTNDVNQVFACSFKGGRRYIRLPNELNQLCVKIVSLGYLIEYK